MNIYVIYDKKAEQWMTPFMSRTHGTVFRELQSSVTNAPSDNVMKSHPGDFSVYHVGNFNEHEGVLTAVPMQELGTLANIAETNSGGLGA